MQEFDRFMEVVRELRKKCPWDSVQTHESLKPYLMEEAGEVLEGIDHLNAEGDSQNLCEELGDVLFQVALHSVIAEEEKTVQLQSNLPIFNLVPDKKQSKRIIFETFCSEVLPGFFLPCQLL
jgi:uncharacterized protein YabN with tetrapyrrole methylase and pyrophosphatase domain